ncbi:uncharacterized protein CLAFUR5_04038 [Fulvia fulva]|uniref:Uncharacterized protein n=1 Tax=Passalora fulva TaxID=5499 RepID=A0A9Q8P858_PASFU|nr:uncharacterized protein CLAFUR5_04038 [Fulvia fulva]KAK4627779.1 hypothetical protein CLAFUR0_04062 [Fulvia fulva]UJO16607.1 hypothetical protein CLAFUR5_04038 [Fulvia fulva]
MPIKEDPIDRHIRDVADLLAKHSTGPMMADLIHKLDGLDKDATRVEEKQLDDLLMHLYRKEGREPPCFIHDCIQAAQTVVGLERCSALRPWQLRNFVTFITHQLQIANGQLRDELTKAGWDQDESSNRDIIVPGNIVWAFVLEPILNDSDTNTTGVRISTPVGIFYLKHYLVIVLQKGAREFSFIKLTSGGGNAGLKWTTIDRIVQKKKINKHDPAMEHFRTYLAHETQLHRDECEPYSPIEITANDKTITWKASSVGYTMPKSQSFAGLYA